jgi:hypothetical protein
MSGKKSGGSGKPGRTNSPAYSFLDSFIESDELELRILVPWQSSGPAYPTYSSSQWCICLLLAPAVFNFKSESYKKPWQLEN